MGKDKGSFLLHLCPGTIAEKLLHNHSSPDSTPPGQVDLYDISIEPSSFSEPKVPRLKGGVQTEPVIYKTVGDLEMVLLLDFPENPPNGKMPVAFCILIAAELR